MYFGILDYIYVHYILYFYNFIKIDILKKEILFNKLNKV